jgi:hypothetical protein
MDIPLPLVFVVLGLIIWVFIELIEDRRRHY